MPATYYWLPDIRCGVKKLELNCLKIFEMKEGTVKFLLLVAIISLAACKEDVPTLFNEHDGVYFNSSKDSVFYTFAKYPSRLADTIKLPVNVLGNSAAVDREITIEKVSGAGINAVEGLHYKLLPPYKLPANSYSTTIPVVVYRTADLDSMTASLVLKLSPNATFNSGITSKTSIKLNISYLQKPPTWGEIAGLQWAGYAGNFGTWTKTKYKVILDALYDPVSDTTVSEFPYNRTAAPAVSIQYLQMVRNYIRNKYPGNYSNPVGIGPTLRDPDANNALVVVGPSY
jgi:hypothetical protein